LGIDRRAVAGVAARQVAGLDRSSQVTDDWFDFVAALLNARARFLVVGAHALAAHGVPRATQDLDVWIDSTKENALRVWDAFQIFGAPAEAIGVTLIDLSAANTVIQFGVPPNRIDILTAISGVPSFDGAWAERIELPVRGRDVPFLGRAAFVANKRASGRHKDLGDIESLGEKT
jgi:hypothetical protein